MSGEALMHMDGCHFYVWVTADPVGGAVFSYSERRGNDLRVHGRFGDEDGDCERCQALRRGAAPQSFSKHMDDFPTDGKAAFYAVMVATAEAENELFGAGEGSRPSSPVAPDGPAQAPSASQGDGSGEARRLATGASGVEGRPVTESADPRDLADKLRNEDDAALRNYLSRRPGLEESSLGVKLDCGCYGVAHPDGVTITAAAFLCPLKHEQNDFSAQVIEEDDGV